VSTTNGLNVSMQGNYTEDDFDRIRSFLGSDRYNDQDSFLSSVYGKSYATDRVTSVMEKAPLSLANRYSLFTYMGLWGSRTEDLGLQYIDGYNNSVASINSSREISAHKIIQFFQDTPDTGGIEYAYSDFIFCKYYKYIPNNYLITLRRFGAPCEDNIYKNEKRTVKKGDKSQSVVDVTMPDIARAVTFMSEQAGNKMEDILSFAYGYNYKEQTSEVTTQFQSNENSYTSSPVYQQSGVIGQTILDTVRGSDAGKKYQAQYGSGAETRDPLMETYENFVLGPVNVINKMQTRDIGLNFEQDLKLKFTYSLKTIADINPKIAMLDIFANLLVLTYSNANFWGGANRFLAGGGFVASRFGDVDLLRGGKMRDYYQSVVSAIVPGLDNLKGTSDGGRVKINLDVKNGVKGFIESVQNSVESLFSSKGTQNLLGNMMGGFINKFLGAPPAAMHTKGLITGESTGNWHVTIGNPINPIAMIGNLIMSDAVITFGGGLGYDDFPTELNMEVTLKHARPRDKTDFESIFNAGKGRLYAAPEGFGDVLNLKGKDVDVYGAFQFDDKGRKKGKVDKDGKGYEFLGKDEVKDAAADAAAGLNNTATKISSNPKFVKFKGKADDMLFNLKNFIHT
jgi:hypothetical protein